jgi:peroxiredoxin
MKKSVLLFLVSFFSPAALLAQTNPADTFFIIKGTISGVADGTEVKLVNANNQKELAKTKFQKNLFTLKGSVAEPVLCFLQVAGVQPAHIYMENKKISVSGTKAAIQHLTVSGSSSHADFISFQQTFNPLVQQLNITSAALQPLPPGPDRDSLMNVLNGNLQTIQLQIDQYIDQHPASFVSPFVLFVTNDFSDDPLRMEKRYNRLSPAIRASAIGKNLEQFIAYNKVGAVGTDAIDFSQPDTTGVPVSLSSFRGKYVLVDFWASWCGPCRLENPNVVENFNKFKEKNFTVLGVSLDRPGQKEKWLEAIKKDKLSWTHVSDLQFWNNAAAQLYHVSGIPFNFLVDPDGKIIGRNLRGLELGTKLCEVLGCN